MKLLILLFRRETAIPVAALTFASGVSVALVVARVAWTGRIHYAFLIWNLFLAWLPLVFALLAHERFRGGRISRRPEREPSSARSIQGEARTIKLRSRSLSNSTCEPTARAPFFSTVSNLWRQCREAFAGRDWRFFGFVAAWLLFFPNAPYIFTDLIHLTTRYYGHFWVDLVLVLSCALTGLVLGFLSLYLMHCMALKMFGWFLSWVFIAVVAGLSSFGIYLGRFLRFNSWDIIFKPIALYHGIGSWVADPLQSSRTAVFPVLFATFLFISYVMLYALTHLKPATADQGTSNALAVI